MASVLRDMIGSTPIPVQVDVDRINRTIVSVLKEAGFTKEFTTWRKGTTKVNLVQGPSSVVARIKFVDDFLTMDVVSLQEAQVFGEVLS